MSQVKTREIEGDVAVGRHVAIGGNSIIQGHSHVKKNLKVDGWLEVKNIKGPNKGLFLTPDKLQESYPIPHSGWWALVGESLPAQLYISDGGVWVAQTNSDGTPKLVSVPSVDSSEWFLDLMEKLRPEIKDAKTTADAAKKVTDTKGQANGLAPLDNQGKVPSGMIPSVFDNIKLINEMSVESVDAVNEKSANMAADSGCIVVYSKESKRLYLGVPRSAGIEPVTQQDNPDIEEAPDDPSLSGGDENIPSVSVMYDYYSDWEDAACFGNVTDQGVSPVSDKLYYIISERKPYWWNGEDLADSGTVRDFMEPVTWAELIALRDESSLTPGMKYRITDYECTTTQDDTRSAGHGFDIVVTALDENTLSEQAGAVRRQDDEYFAQSKLEAWQIWYCPDNDTCRFLWADKDNGKGVVYRMIDEFGNDCPYDFKNIQFKRYRNSGYDWYSAFGYYGIDGCEKAEVSDYDDFVWCYTFNNFKFVATQETVDELIENFIFGKVSDPDIYDNYETDAFVDKNDPVDSSLNLYWNIMGTNTDLPCICRGNVIKPYRTAVYLDNISYGLCVLNNVVMYSDYDFGDINEEYESCCFHVETSVNNIIGPDCRMITIGANSLNNKIGAGCHEISLGANCFMNQIGCGCYDITILNAKYNIVENDCYDIFINNNYNKLGLELNGIIISGYNNTIIKGSQIVIYENSSANIVRGGSNISIRGNNNTFEQGCNAIDIRGDNNTFEQDCNNIKTVENLSISLNTFKTSCGKLSCGNLARCVIKTDAIGLVIPKNVTLKDIGQSRFETYVLVKHDAIETNVTTWRD